MESNLKLLRKITSLKEELKETKLRSAGWEAKYRDLMRRLFGPKSEKMDPMQLALALEAIEADKKMVEAEPPVPPEKPEPRRAKQGGGRRPVPQHLPVERVVIDIPQEQRVGMIMIREEVNEEIDYKPSQFIRRQIVRPVYVSANKEESPVQALAPKRVIPGSSVGTSLIAHILVSRFCDHLPYYRLEQIAARQGVALERQKMGAWVEHAALLLMTPYEQLKQEVLKSGYVQVDETPIKVMDPERPNATRASWLWIYHAPTTKCLVFDYNISRGQDSPRAFFPPDWRGVVQCDGYGVYPALFDQREGVTLAGCWAHARRAWVNVVDQGGHDVAEVLALIQKLYRVEAEIKDASPEERSRLRSLRSIIPLARIKTVCDQVRLTALPSSDLGKAASYVVDRWPQLALYAQPGFGRLVIDNNPAERGIRPTALGKKNWLFIGHPDAGWRSAVIYSLVGSCKLAGVNPFDYFVWALNRLASATTSTVGRLLPTDFLCAVKEQP